MSERVLSQGEIDNGFRSSKKPHDRDDVANQATPYDFRRPDRIAKEQLRSIHLLHENFARLIGSSLSGYLRTFVVANLVSVEQLAFSEFARCLPSPSCIVTLGLRPYEGNAILEVNHSLIFPIFEMLLGGTGKSPVKIDREITEIEKSILENVFRIVLKEFRDAWQSVSPIDFVIESHETDPQVLQILGQNEAVVAVSLELLVGGHSGLMNICIPSMIIKMLRQKFDQQWTARKSQPSESEHARMLRLTKRASVEGEVRLNGPQMRLQDLLEIHVGDVVTFDHSLGKEFDFFLNGKPKFSGHVVSSGTKRAFQIKEEHQPAD